MYAQTERWNEEGGGAGNSYHKRDHLALRPCVALQHSIQSSVCVRVYGNLQTIDYYLCDVYALNT